jgi:hypothetical protein
LVVVHGLVGCGIVTRLAQHPSKSEARKVGAKDDGLSIVEAQDTGVKEDSIFHIFQDDLSCVRPVPHNRVGEVLLSDLT